MSVASAIQAITQPLSQLLPGAGSSSTGASSSSAAPTAAAASQANTTAAQQSLAGDQQTFLKLLTAQLKNQDPLSPMDTNQFTQQLVAMTGVQQQITTNTLLQQLVNNQGGMGDPVSLIGKTVTAPTTSGTLQAGKANWLYSLDAPAKDVTLQLTDSLGRIIWQQDAGQMAAGEHALSWDGKDLQGQQRPDGSTYTLSATATNDAGQSVATHIYRRGLAQSVEQDSGQTVLTVDGVKIPVGSVTSVGSGA